MLGSGWDSYEEVVDDEDMRGVYGLFSLYRKGQQGKGKKENGIGNAWRMCRGVSETLGQSTTSVTRDMGLWDSGI
jgi:hypothetical protein